MKIQDVRDPKSGGNVNGISAYISVYLHPVEIMASLSFVHIQSIASVYVLVINFPSIEYERRCPK